MCDIYCAKCAKCDTEIEMHLGDFNTDPDEIDVFCGRHAVDGTIRRKRWVMWSSPIFGSITVVSLTDNAWENREGNHPNDGDVVKVRETLE